MRKLIWFAGGTAAYLGALVGAAWDADYFSSLGIEGVRSGDGHPYAPTFALLAFFVASLGAWLIGRVLGPTSPTVQLHGLGQAKDRLASEVSNLSMQLDEWRTLATVARASIDDSVRRVAIAEA